MESVSAKRKRLSPCAGALIAAVRAKDEAYVRSLLDDGADVNERNAYQATPLHLVAWHDLTAIADVLLSRGADIEARDINGWTPLHRAAYYPSAATLALLLRRGASVHARSNNGDTPLHIAAYHGRTAIAELLIEAGAAPDATNNDGWTPLFFAADSYLETSALLLAHYPAAAAHADTALRLRNNFAPADVAAAVTHAAQAPAIARRRDVCIAWLMVRALP